jgi:tetratricopeptide (TPR) repeat protein
MRGQTDQALEAAERAFRVALDLQSGNSEHPTVASARVFLANALEDSGQPARAVQESQAAVKDTVAVFGPASRIVGIRTALLAERQLAAGAVRDALATSTAAIEILGKHLEPTSRTYAAAIEIRGLALLAARRGAEAADELWRARTVYEKIYGPGTIMPATVTRSRALALAFAGQLTEAERDLKALAGGPRLANDAYDVTSQVLGLVELLQGEPQAAAALLQKAQVSMPESPGLAITRHQLQIHRGVALVGLQSYDEALSVLEDALQQHARMRMHVSPLWSDAMVATGRSHLELGRVGEAQKYLEQADAFWRDFDPQSRWSGEAAYWYGRSLSAMGRDSEAAGAYERAAAILARSPFPGDAHLARVARRS